MYSLFSTLFGRMGDSQVLPDLNDCNRSKDTDIMPAAESQEVLHICLPCLTVVDDQNGIFLLHECFQFFCFQKGKA